MEQQLKQRLVGAVVLVSLAVIFIPIILEGPGDEWTPREQTIPPPPQLDYRTDMELPVPDIEEATGVVQEADNSDAKPVSSAVVRAPEPAAAPVPAAAVTPDTSRAEPETTLADGWYAQVGSFSQQANAAGLRERLTKAGYNAWLQETEIGKGSSYRVLVGPEQGREGAEKLLRKLAAKLRLKGIVIEQSTPSG